MATFYRLPSGLWRAQVARRGIRRSATRESKAAAIAWAGSIEAEIMAGTRGEIPNLTVAALLERYEREVSAHKKGKRWEEVRLSMFGRDPLALVKLRQLDAPHVGAWQQRRLKAVKPATVRRERNLLNNVFEIARKEWRWLGKNPFEGIRRPKDGKHRKRTATQAELDKLGKKASERMGRVIVWAVETGMRAGEIAACQEVRGRVAYLYDSKNGEAREVPLSKEALEAWTDGGFWLTAGSISELFARLCGDCNVEELTFHDLRHTACTRLAKKLSVLDLCKMMGWKDPRHAMIYYNPTTDSIADKL